MTTFSPTDDARGFRNALGSFTTGVTIVTTATDEGPVGITANSFASVSLDPPLVLWSPAKQSSRFSIFHGAVYFAIHVLAEEQLDIAQSFLRTRDGDGSVDWQMNPNGVPLIADCLARFDCKTEALHDAGDHVIILGRVLGVTRRDGTPLAFHGGAFGTFAGPAEEVV